MVMLIVVAFGFVYAYQLHLYTRFKTGRAVRKATTLLLCFSLIYCVAGYYNPAWINPNRVIRAVFKPIQSWVEIKR